MKISTVQNNLVDLGYGKLLGKYKVDGVNGKFTRNAVRVFQSDYNIKFNKNILIDGVAKSQTKKAFEHWKREAGKKGTKNFKISEFYCKGTGKMLSGGMDNQLLLKLERLRFNLGNNPIIVTSGYRTPQHNKIVGGATKSQHLYGKAADIKVNNKTANTVYNEAIKLFNGVGKYPTFTHVDTRANKVRF